MKFPIDRYACLRTPQGFFPILLREGCLFRLCFRARTKIVVEIEVPADEFRLVMEALLTTKGRLTRTEAAQIANLSPTYFSRSFRRIHGQTFASVRTEIRLAFAAQLLLETSLRISDIVATLGYRDPRQFRSLFKRKYRFPPKVYRLQNAQNTPIKAIKMTFSKSLTLE